VSHVPNNVLQIFNSIYIYSSIIIIIIIITLKTSSRLQDMVASHCTAHE